MTDADGRVTSQSKATTRSLTWTSFDGIRTITDNGVTATYIYDAFGQIVRTDVDAATDSSIYRIPAGGGYDYAVYKRVGSGDVVPVEWTLFGMGRMGVSRDVASSKSGDVSYRRVGAKLYELTDHLGSVRALVPDIKLPSGGSYIVEPVSVYEYDAYGIARVTRSADLKEPYRYGFQGMLRMSEVAPSTTIINDYATLFRTYDARTGRWTSHDPILQPWESIYAGLAGNPAMLTDWYGLTTGGGDQPAASNSDASKPGGNSAPPQPSTAQPGGGQMAVPMVPMPPIDRIGHSYVILNINVVADRPFSLTHSLPTLPNSLGAKPERSQSDATSVALIKGGGTDALANVIEGTAKVVAGGVIMTAGAATAEIGVGVVVFAIGADLAASGVNQIIYDAPQETILKQVARGTLETAGVPKEYAEPMASGIEMGIQTVAGGVRPVTARALTVTSTETVSTPGVVFSAVDDVATKAATVLDDVAEAGVVGPTLVDEAAVVAGPVQGGVGGAKTVATWGMNTYKHGGEMYAIEHIMYRHSYFSGFTNVGRFTEGTSVRQVRGMVDDALHCGTQTSPGTFEYNFGRTIGTNQGGGKANGIRVHVRNGMIQSTYPITIP